VRQTTSTGQWFASRDGGRWWFDSGSIALDFAYTGAMGDNPEWERLHAAADLGDWLEPRFPGVDGAATDGDLRDATMLRGAIAAAAVAVSTSEGDGVTVGPKDVDVINLFAATPDVPPALAGGSRQAGRTKARVGQLLSTIAREAVELFDEDKIERIRKCAADDCGLVFYDESRSNNRRWCSMQRCGNRAKVRAHRARA
jgi:predicted RNA-binding Zn ribbon-like protein